MLKSSMLLPGIVIIFLAVLISHIPIVWSQYADLPVISTRDHYDQANGTPKSNSTFYDVVDYRNKISSCSPEIVIYVHGAWVGNNSLEKPAEVFDRLGLSLNHNGYEYTLIGFSWDSDTQIDKDGHGWNIAKLIAKQNGKNLANFITNYKNDCPNAEVRILAHSLGSRVVVEAIRNLDGNLQWNQQQQKLLSVDLLGAAIDDEEVSTNPNDRNDDKYQPRADAYDPIIKSVYGDAIERQVIQFHNWYNPEDDVLEPEPDCISVGFFCQPIYYPKYEGDLALGSNGSQSTITQPINYNETNIENEIAFEKDSNAENGCDLIDPDTLACTIYRVGDNHFGYIGFRDTDNRNNLIAYGAIPKVIQSWIVH
ncbi:MAG TPA: alpha/beta hydrolase [Candidatus Saccharimonadales bacterium]|nr:alpha/beta hydrolase [Candidatus Saccharimonadales bacterium]